MAGAISAIRENEVVIVAPEQSGCAPETSAVSAACLARIRDLFPDAMMTIGIGGTCRDPAEIARSYGQARRTIDAVVRLGHRGQVVAFEDLGIHRLLLQVPDLAELRSFAGEILGELDRPPVPEPIMRIDVAPELLRAATPRATSLQAPARLHDCVRHDRRP